MTDRADVVIIGGGVVGASVAYHLAERGCANVVVVEREAEQGRGSTGRATGGVRAQFGTDVNVLMSLYSIDFFSRFEEATGHGCGYRPDGYLFVATGAAQLEQLKRNRERQVALGLKNAEIVTAEEVARMVPQLRTDDVLGGSFCQTDGLIEPLAVMRGFTRRAQERGARLLLGAEVTGVDVDSRGVAAVRTTRGTIATRAVVNAAGAWAARVARLAGVELPVVPLRRQLVATKPFALLPERMPMVIDLSNGFHFRRIYDAGAPPGVLLAGNDPEETPGFKQEFDPGFIPKVFAQARARVPVLAGAEVDLSRSRAGLYEMTPDRHAVIGEAPGVRGLYLANGFSGHGVMHSPATGRLVSELILDGRASLLDIVLLGLERFAAGRLLEEAGTL